MPFGIGVEYMKKEVNLGTLLRSAYNLGAAFVFTIGRRYRHQASDTVKAFRHFPVLHYLTWEEYAAHAPLAWSPVGVELGERAVPLRTFTHPPAAVYWLGPEDGSLSAAAQRQCQTVIQIPSRYCLNVSVAASIVMYDRMVKSHKEV